MNRLFIYLLCMLGSTSQILPLIIQKTIVAHPVTKKRVVLLDECHTFYLEDAAQKDDLASISRIYSSQKKELINLANRMLTIKPEQGAQIALVTESPYIEKTIDEEIGLAPEMHDKDTVAVIPRIFIQALTKSGLSPQDKDAIIRKATQKFHDLPSASFVLPNGMHWILGDRQRKDTDRYLFFTVYHTWQEIQKKIAAKTLSKKEARQTIGHVITYIESLNSAFMKHNVGNNEYYKNIKKIMTDALTSKKVRETDHLALLHSYLHASGHPNLSDEFNENLFNFIAYKLDVELLYYFDAFKHDKNLTCMVFIGGGIHNTYIRENLLAQGYVIEVQTGLDESYHDLLNACLLKEKKISEWLDAMQEKLPALNLHELNFFDPPVIPPFLAPQPLPLPNIAMQAILEKNYSSLKQLY